MQNQIVSAARSWLGTRFHHQGRLKRTASSKGGVDCLGLLIGAAAELRLPLTGYDEADYAHYPDIEKLKNKMARAMQEIAISDICAGDILLLSVDNRAQHLAIVSDMGEEFGMIHAYAPARAVVEHVIDEWWHDRIVAAYRVN